MNLKFLLIIICTVFLSTCGDSDNSALIPKSVGKATLDKDYSLNQIWLSSDNVESPFKHSTAYYRTDDGNRFYYHVEVHENQTFAQEKVKIIANAHKKNWDENGKETGKETEAPLKDKSGKEVGQVNICQQGSDFDRFSDFDFTLRKDNLIFEFRVAFDNKDIQKITNKGFYISKKHEELVDFIKAFPFNANLDLSVLDEVIAESNNNRAFLASLILLSPPVQLAKEPYLKGKTYVVTNIDELPVLYNPPRNRADTLLDKSRKAKNVNEIGSILKVVCDKGSVIGSYATPPNNIDHTILYSSFCKVTVIDYTIPAIIAQKTFSKNFPPPDNLGGGGGGGGDVLAPLPMVLIKNFISSLPNK